MKILSIEQVRLADEYTIKNEPVASVDLMERAGNKCYKWLKGKIAGDQRVMIFCGPGNNGGDGLVIARLLRARDFNIDVYVVAFSDKSSKDFSINLERLQKMKSVRINTLREGDEFPSVDPDDVVIDAIFGSGLTRPVRGFTADLIRHINRSVAVVVSIDIPSGMFADVAIDIKRSAIIKADFTISFQLPKLAFLLPESEAFVGEWHLEDIGLHEEFIESAKTQYYFLGKEMASALRKPRSRFAHKGHYGHALLIAGSYGKMGASVLAAQACINTGVGLIHAHIPAKGYDIMQTAVPEAMISLDPDEFCFSEVPDLSLYNAVGIGPGIGFNGQTRNALKVLIQNSGVPIVFDADALTILGENKTWISFVPKLSVFTPHPKEFSRLVGSWKDDFERLDKQREFSVKHTSYVVLKGANTSISCPDGAFYFNSTGNPGMASGGSGDVLTGMILSLIAQKYSPKDACLLGVYLHGLAGDIAACKNSQEAVTASMMASFIGKAYNKID